ncbi:PAS domain-containing protein [Haloplanus sp. GCM10025708]|uniref:PAS domain-containing protein n=1 Tax=Haloplanus sp. GCM10025708 TaxID=3252679 RepID=UPI003615D004
MLDLFPEAERDRLSNAVETALETGSVTVEADLVTADGTRIPHEFTGRRLSGPDGDFLGLVGVGRDLSERKEHERALERVHDLLDKTERIADVGGWEIDTSTMDVFWTEHLFDILQVEYDEEPPLDEALDVYHEDDRSIVENAIEEALATGEPFDVEVRFVTPADEVRWLRVKGLPATEDGTVVTLRGAVQDITDRKRYERTLNGRTTASTSSPASSHTTFGIR